METVEKFKDIKKKERELKKELVSVLKKYDVISNNYIGKVVLDVNQGGIRDLVLHHKLLF